jgi:hypothetical protein
MFPSHAPAKNINELLDYLNRHQQPDDYFRGQTRFYDSNAPSAIRPATLPPTKAGAGIPLDSNYWERATSRDRARADLQIALMNVWGQAVGQLLCQQYGISSDGFDFTSSPETAAFFATRKYPSYQPYTPSSADELGIIYRFRTDFSQSRIPLAVVEATVNLRFLFDELGRKVVFPKVVPADQILRANARHGGSIDLASIIRSELPDPTEVVYVDKANTFVAHQLLLELFSQTIAATKIPLYLIDMANTRAARQSGCMFFPSVRHRAIVAKERKVEKRMNGRWAAEPPTVVLLEPSQISELNSNESIEKFFFIHDSQIAVSARDNSYYWPSRLEDPLYAYVCKVAEKLCGDYLNSAGADADTPESGLVDPGYW